MAQLDKDLKEMAKNMDVPEAYSRRLDETLKALPEQTQKKSKTPGYYYVFRAAVVCVVCVALFFVGASAVHADFLARFKKSLKDYLHLAAEEATEELGVEVDSREEASRPELMMHLEETVVGKHNLYLLVRMEASQGVRFADNVGFEYFVFCRGDSYNMQDTIGGAIGCTLLEQNRQNENAAVYVVTLSTEEEIADGETVTVFFRNLSENPSSDAPNLFVDGMWKLTFTADYTVTDEISRTDIPDASFLYMGENANVTAFSVTPLNMLLTVDITAIPSDVFNVSDTSLDIRLRMIDGTELPVMNHNLDIFDYIAEGSSVFDMVEDKSYYTIQFSFREAMPIEKVVGIYVEDTYIPVRE